MICLEIHLPERPFYLFGYEGVGSGIIVESPLKFVISDCLLPGI